MNQSDAVLDFNGYMHRLNSVVSAAKASRHEITVSADQVHNFLDTSRAFVINWPNDFKVPDDTPTILFKFNGKFMILTNTNKSLLDGKKEITGLVISTVGLKNCRIADDQIPTVVPQDILDARNNERVRNGNTDWLKHAGTVRSIHTPAAPAHPQEFRNAPRFSTNKRY